MLNNTTTTILFCPKSLANTLEEFGKVNSEKVYLKSHKCYFKQNTITGLWELEIMGNSYSASLERTYTNTYNML